MRSAPRLPVPRPGTYGNEDCSAWQNRPTGGRACRERDAASSYRPGRPTPPSTNRACSDSLAIAETAIRRRDQVVAERYSREAKRYKRFLVVRSAWGRRPSVVQNSTDADQYSSKYSNRVISTLLADHRFSS